MTTPDVVEVDGGSFGSRAAACGFHCIAGWTDPTDDDQVMSWASRLHEEMATHASGGVYLLLIADDEPERIPSAYGDNYSRLVQLQEALGSGKPVPVQLQHST